MTANKEPTTAPSVPPDDGGEKPWGNFWEATYDSTSPNWRTWQLLDTDGAFEEGTKACPRRDYSKILGSAKAANVVRCSFIVCEFNHFSIEKGSFTAATFERCRFVSATFTDVKFSGCTFSKCHFLHARFIRCRFIDCTFDAISASSEHVVFQETSIPASAFLSALSVNLRALPPQYTAGYQEHRHIKSAARIANLLHFSNSYHADIELYYDAFREFQMRDLDWRRADAEYEQTQNEQKQFILKRRGFASRLRALRYSADKGIVRISGWATDWGRSPTVCVLTLFVVVLIFSIAHFVHAFLSAVDAKDWTTYAEVLTALDRSLSTTLVYGYSVHAQASDPAPERILLGVNAVVGLFWYSLVIPVLIGRTLR
jgi:hypothetical protein